MKVSQVDVVAEVVVRLRMLREAKSALRAAQTAMVATVEQPSYYDGPKKFDIAALVTKTAVRRVFLELVDHEINGCLEHLKTYGVDDD